MLAFSSLLTACHAGFSLRGVGAEPVMVVTTVTSPPLPGRFLHRFDAIGRVGKIAGLEARPRRRQIRPGALNRDVRRKLDPRSAGHASRAWRRRGRDGCWIGERRGLACYSGVARSSDRPRVVARVPGSQHPPVAGMRDGRRQDHHPTKRDPLCLPNCAWLPPIANARRSGLHSRLAHASWSIRMALRGVTGLCTGRDYR